MSSDYIELCEWRSETVFLSAQDSQYLAQLSFTVIPTGNSRETLLEFNVNPQQFVGHFCLPSGRNVSITPKIQAAAVFRMLGYVYCRSHPQVFRPEQVEYSRSSLLFEPLVRLFNSLVERRARTGLVKDYVGLEENLSVYRGQLALAAHLQVNSARPEKVYCKYFENTADIPDNQLVKSALLKLARHSGWTRRTERELVGNLRLFSEVSEVHVAHHLGPRHYHRLNDDYRFLHALSLLFLKGLAISEEVGTIPFNGFLLDMNKLFEQFIEEAFVAVCSRSSGVSAFPQRSRPLAQLRSAPSFQPDMTIDDDMGRPISVVDAKYKRDSGMPQNSDLYQVIAYAVASRCKCAFLFYPETETAPETLRIRNTNICVKVMSVDLSDEDSIEVLENKVEETLKAALLDGFEPSLVAHPLASHSKAAKETNGTNLDQDEGRRYQ